MCRSLQNAMARCCLAGVAILVIGCGVREETLSSGQKQIELLQSKGVPDSVLSGAKVFLFEARDARERGHYAQARKAADSMNIMLRKVEHYYDNYVSGLQPVIDSLLSVAGNIRGELSGMQIRKLDSVVAVVDSLAKAGRPVEAEKTARALAASIPALRADEEKTRELRAIIPGSTWEYVFRKSSDVHKEVNAVEKKVFSFLRNGNATFVESEKGRSDQNTRTDYEFASFGTYDIAADTIYVFVNRFAARRQIIEARGDKDGKEYWKRDVGPTYDSLITDGSQDRWVTLADLREDFKRR